MDQTPMGHGASAQSRRDVLRCAVALAAAGVIGDRQDSLAGRGWCRSDPLITIEGVPADIFCTGRLTTPLLITGSTQIVVRVPVGVSTALVLAGPGFGRGEKLRFEETDQLQQSDSAVDLEVAVYVPAKNDLAIGVEFAPRIVGILNPARAEGFANQWITLTTQLKTGGLLGLLPLDANEHRDQNGRVHARHKGKRKRHHSR
jgi:hypothetical protein